MTKPRFLTVYVDSDLSERIATVCAEEGLSMSAFVRLCINQVLRARQIQATSPLLSLPPPPTIPIGPAIGIGTIISSG